MSDETGFLPQFADERFLDRLAKLDEPAGECPDPLERGATPANQEDLPCPDPHGVHGKRRVFVASSHEGARWAEY